MHYAKPIGLTLSTNNKMSGDKYPKMKAEKIEMNKIPYDVVVGSLMYAMVCTGLDIAYVVRVLSRFMSKPIKALWVLVMWILWHLRGTSSMCLQFSSSNPMLEGFTDSNMLVDAKSEYMVLVEADKEIILMRDFINDLVMGHEQIHNQSVIHIAKNTAYHSRTKHI